jgi:hypothetical protein
MARKDYSIDEVLKALYRKRDVKVQGNSVLVLADFIYSKGVKIPNPAKTGDLGNKSWGKIDFLVNHKGYYLSHVDKF